MGSLFFKKFSMIPRLERKMGKGDGKPFVSHYSSTNHCARYPRDLIRSVRMDDVGTIDPIINNA